MHGMYACMRVFSHARTYKLARRAVSSWRRDWSAAALQSCRPCHAPDETSTSPAEGSKQHLWVTESNAAFHL